MHIRISLAAALVIAAMLVTACTGGDNAVESGGERPYAGLQGRDVSTLSDDDVNALLDGEGLGYAMPAELNDYSGPAHVLQLAGELGIDNDQLAEIERIEAEMRTAARDLGRQLIDAEYQLDEAFRDGTAVALLYGAVPMYRDLRQGDSGADAEQLEANLESLDYEGFTAEAVREWQADIGASETGTVSHTDVVFLPAGGRVDALHVGVGYRVSPGTPILDITGTEQVVSLEVDVNDRDRLGIDTEVTVVLPGGDEVPGTVSATAVVEIRPEEGFGDAESEQVAQIEITLDEQVPDELVGAPVEVIVAIDERADVLLVPVNALLALAEGGYGLEVVNDDGTTEIVPVTTGLFADGKVQVDSDDIAEGTVVRVAGR
jgi:hypothetical protein